MDPDHKLYAYVISHSKKPEYTIYKHCGKVGSGSGSKKKNRIGFDMNIPVQFIEWEKEKSFVSFSSANTPKLRCRCGIIENSFYFNLPRNEKRPICIKITDKNQTKLQGDDAQHEINIMSKLQPRGFNNIQYNKYFLRWDHIEDKYNDYIGMEKASNKNLLHYASKSIDELFYEGFRALKKIHQHKLSREYARSALGPHMGFAWMQEGLRIYKQIIKGVINMHSKNICHLDIDVNNIVVTWERSAKIIDFGSSQITDNTKLVGVDGSTLIKFKKSFAAPEQIQNTFKSDPTNGFDGHAADMWSCGVLLYQILCWGYPNGSDAMFERHANWRICLYDHIEAAKEIKDKENQGEHIIKNEIDPHLGKKRNCYLCKHNIEFPFPIYIALDYLLDEEPSNRATAEEILPLLNCVVGV